MSLALTSCLLVLIVLATIGASVPLSMIVAAIVYLAVKGQDMGLAAEQIIQGLYDSFVILAVPLFIIAANVMNSGSITTRLNDFCVALVGRFRGGLGHVNIVVSIIFSGMSGSAVADAAGTGKISIDLMTKNNRYTPGYAAAITAASAVIGPIIPPSIPMVLYALVSDTSVGYLFIGGAIPGLLIGAALMGYNHFIAVRRGFPVDEKVPLAEIPRKTMRAFPVLLMPFILLYGIYGGIATPTEAAAMAAAYALLLAAFYYRELTWRSLYAVTLDGARASASIGLLIGGALIFNYIVAAENIPGTVSAWLTSLQISPLAFMIAVNLLLLVLGCLLDASTIILVILPLFVPTCKALGIDLVHFGVVTVVNAMIGLITPPYGLLLFVMSSLTRVPLTAIIREIWPFVLVLTVLLALLTFVPGITLFLPRLFGYT